MRREIRTRLVSAFGALTLSVPSYAAAPPSTSPLKTYVGDYTNRGTAFSPYFIADEAHLWSSANIEVCWESVEASLSNERGWVRGAVNNFIEANSAFRFGGQQWAQCDASTRARVRILVADDGNAAESEVGHQDFGPTYMRMDFRFQNWNPACAQTEAQRQRCIETIAVHEFLHAVGTLHEQLSKDLETADPKCWQLYKNSSDVGGTRPVSLTNYDPDSIMNYCHDIYSTPTHLSKLDLIGLKSLSARYAG